MIEQIGRLTPEQSAELAAGEADPFGVDELSWLRKEHHTVLRGPDGRLIASVGLVVVDVAAGAETFPVAGVGGVIVSRPYRRQGHLRPTLDAALERAATLAARAMLFCSAANVARYARFGFVEIAAPVYVQQPGGEQRMPPHAMWRPLHAGATWPEGDVRLPGLPF